MFDIVEMAKDQPNFRLSLASELNRFDKITHVKGEYRFKVLVEGQSVKRAEGTVELNWKGSYDTFEVNGNRPPTQT